MGSPANARSQSLTVRFNDEVTLYGINTLRWSSDAFLGIPLDAIGRDYTIMSYPSTSEPGPAGQIFETSDFPSQFAVVATQDGTQITVEPTVSVNAPISSFAVMSRTFRITPRMTGWRSMLRATTSMWRQPPSLWQTP